VENTFDEKSSKMKEKKLFFDAGLLRRMSGC